MTEEKLTEISKKLNVLISLNLRQLTGENQFGGKEKRMKNVGVIAQYLSDMGIDSRDIADILGAPVRSVQTLLTPKRRK